MEIASPLRPYLDRVNNRLPANVRVGHGTLYIGSSRLNKFATTLSNYPRIFKPIHKAGSLVLGIIGLSTLFLLLTSAYVITTNDITTAANNPKNAVLIPGVNDFIPVSIAPSLLIVVFVSAFVHELGHAVVMKMNDVPVKEIGMACLFGVPVGAYVEPNTPDDGSWYNLNNQSTVREIASAGIGQNLILLLVTVPFIAVSPSAFVHEPMNGIAAVLLSQTAAPFQGISVAAQLVFWTWFLNLNLIMVNALPVLGLDGGYWYGSWLKPINDSVPNVEIDTDTVAIGLTTVVVIGAFGLIYVVPWL